MAEVGEGSERDATMSLKFKEQSKDEFPAQLQSL